MSLLAPWWANYYHWTLQIVPRLELARRAGLFDSVDRWLVAAGSRPYVHEWLELLGVPASAVHIVSAEENLRCEKLVVTSSPGPTRWVPPWAGNFVRAHAVPFRSDSEPTCPALPGPPGK